MGPIKAFLGIIFAIALFAPQARAESPLAGPAGTTIFSFFAVLSVVAVVIALWALLQLVGQILRRRIMEKQVAWAFNLLDGAPDFYVAWDSGGQFHYSEGLFRWLGLAGASRDYASLCAKDGGGIDPEDFAALTEMVGRLREPGPFLGPNLRLRAGEKHLSAEGRQLSGLAATGAQPCVVWLKDATADRAGLSEKDQQIKAALATSRAFQEVLDLVGIPMWRRRADLTLEWVNAAYVKAVEAPSREYVIEQQSEIVSNALPVTLSGKTGRPAGDDAGLIEKHYAVIGGQRRAIEIVHQQSSSPGSLMIGYALDVTEVDDKTSELARYTESQAETLNKLSTAVAIFAADKTLEYFNSAFVKLWKLPEDWLVARPHHSELLEMMRELRRLPEQADFPAWKQQQISLYTDLIEPLDEMWYLPDNTSLRVVFQPHPLGGLLIFFEDVTDHLALERSYNTLFAVQRATLNNLHEAAAVFGSDGRLKLYNAAFCKIWNLSDDYLIETPHVSEIVEHCRDYFPGTPDGEAFGLRMVSDEHDRVIRAHRLQRTDNSVIDYTLVPLPDGATLLTYLDVTDSIHIERALRERNEALEATDRLKTEFIAHVSYGLRTPLNSLMGFAELLDREYYGPLNSQQHSYTRHILESSSQLMVLINGIIDLSVISAGRMRLEITEIDLPAILTAVAEHIREEAHSRNLVVDVQLPARSRTIRGDEQRIKQVLYNLTGNALKYTPAGGKITLGATFDSSGAQLYVADDGIGIAPDDQEKIFETFQTGKDSPQGQGAGLGLSLVKRFVELHGGRVELVSAVGKGTRVSCIFPSEPAPVSDASGKLPASSAPVS